MQANKKVTINGRLYDAVTGLLVESKPSTSKRTPDVAAKTVHSSTQRSQTLHRRSAKKSTPLKRPTPGRHMDIARSGSIARFAPHPAAAAVEKKPAVISTPDIPHKAHPKAAKALAKTSAAAKAKGPTPTLKQVKDAAISTALAQPKVAHPKKKRFALSRRFTIISATFAVLILAAFLTYANIPGLSVSIAAAQAGINATYPEYRPDGYRLDQPVTFKDGEVTLSFTSNSGGGGYTIVQARSSWDSSAVLDNVVKKAAGDNYITTQERGLTIYSYSSNAVWVNGGILYSIDSDAPLSGEQIRHIATSL